MLPTRDLELKSGGFSPICFSDAKKACFHVPDDISNAS